MGLVQVATETVTSAVASVTLVDSSPTDDVYMLTVKDLQPSTNQVYPYLRFTESGTPNTTANYDYADKNLKAGFSFSNMANSNQTKFFILSEQLGTNTQELLNGIFYLYNANNSSEFTFFSQETTALDHNSNHLGSQGGGVFTSSSSVNGVNLFFSSGNIESGTFTLYKVI